MLIASLALSACVSVTAIVFNIVAILALRRTLALPKKFKILLLSLAVSDVGVGLLINPLHMAIEIMLEKKSSASAATELLQVYYVITNFFGVASLLGIIALTADKFLAIHFHLRYQELVTYKRVVFVVTLVWTFSALLALIQWRFQTEAFVMNASVVIVCLVVAGLFYLRIYVAIKQLTEHRAALQGSPGGENDEELKLNAKRQKKAVVMIFFVYLVTVFCYLPNTVITIIKIVEQSFQTSQILVVVTDTLLLLNSSLNPLIYCWKMKHIRQAVKNILRNFWGNFC